MVGILRRLFIAESIQRGRIRLPINLERKKLYPEDWDRISLLIKEKAGWKCELCQAVNGFPHPITKSMVIITVHHINGDPTDNRKINLIALCQRCHLRLDLEKHMKNRRKSRKNKESKLQLTTNIWNNSLGSKTVSC